MKLLQTAPTTPWLAVAADTLRSAASSAWENHETMKLPESISFIEIFLLLLVLTIGIAAAITILVAVLRKRRSDKVKFEPVHINELIKLMVSLASFVIVCTTMLLLVFQNQTIVTQTKLSQQSLESSVFSTMTSQSLASDDLFLKYPELWPYFYYGKTVAADDPLADKVKAAAEFYLDYFESMVTQLRKYPNLWRSEREGWEANIIDMFAWSPVLCRYLEVNKDWYSEELSVLKKKGESKRQQGHTRQPF